MAGKSEGVTLSEILKGVTDSLNKLKEPAFSKAELESRGIVSSFQNLPCTFDISFTKDTWAEQQTTRIKSSLKHILTGKCSLNDKKLPSQDKETYLTYVEVEIEHRATPTILLLVGRGIGVVLIVATILAAILGGCCLIEHCLDLRKDSKMSWLSVRQFEQFKLIQKAEMSMQYEKGWK